MLQSLRELSCIADGGGTCDDEQGTTQNNAEMKSKAGWKLA